MRRTAKLLLLSAVVIMQGLPPAASQTIEDLRDAFSDSAQAGNFVAIFQAISIFGASPGVSGAAYTFQAEPDAEKTKINLFKVPTTHEFRPTNICLGGAGRSVASLAEVASFDETDDGAFGQRATDPGAHCIRPYAELSLSYLQAEETAPIPAFGDLEIDFDITTLTALAGTGLSIPISKGTLFRPILLFGYSRVTDDSDVSGEFAGVINAAAGGILFDVEINSLILGAAAELRHEHTLTNGIGLEGRLRYNHVLSDVLSASDRSLEQTNDFGVLAANLDARAKTDQTLFSRDLYVLGSVGGTYFPGEQGERIGTDYYYEVGAGLEISEDRIIQGVNGFELFGRYIFGDGVTGYKLGFSVAF